MADKAVEEGTAESEVKVVTAGCFREWDNQLRKEERGGKDLGKETIMGLTREMFTN